MARAPSYRKIAHMFRSNPEEVEMMSEEVVEEAPRRRGGGRQDGALNTHYRNWARQFALATGQIK